MLSDRLPDFPWDLLEPIAKIARSHPAGLIDLSVGTPVDSVAEVITKAASLNLDAHAYGLSAGSKGLIEAQTNWLIKTTGVVEGNFNTIASIGSKEAVSLMPLLLGLGSNSVVVIPEIAYPTYEVGAKVVQAEVIRADHPDLVSAKKVDLVWLNSPGNPTGAIADIETLKAWIMFARKHNAVVVCDECYLTLDWEASASGQPPVSILDKRINNGDLSNILALHSLSKRSSMAGYRAAAISGSKPLIEKILLARKHLGLISSSVTQAASVAAWGDEDHAETQKQIYAKRRATMQAAFLSAGFEIKESSAGLYLWMTRNEDGWESAAWLAQFGILVAPGSFYGPKGKNFIRAALTETDERINQISERLM